MYYLNIIVIKFMLFNDVNKTTFSLTTKLTVILLFYNKFNL